MYHALDFPLYTFSLQYLFLLRRSHSKANAVNQTVLLCVRKRFTIDQLNVQTAMAENEEQCTLSNIILIEFKN